MEMSDLPGKLRDAVLEIDRLRAALRDIDNIACRKKRGAAADMQATARAALAGRQMEG